MSNYEMFKGIGGIPELCEYEGDERYNEFKEFLLESKEGNEDLGRNQEGAKDEG